MLTNTKVAAIKPPATGQDEHRDTKVTGLRLRVGTSGKKTWIVRARAGARIINKKIGSYPAMGLGPARTAAERLLEAIAKDGSTEAAERTFGAVADAWIEKVAKLKNSSWRLQERRLEMHVVGRRDRRVIDAIAFRARAFGLDHRLEARVCARSVDTVCGAGFARALGRARERAGDELGLAVELGRDAMDGADERARPAADHSEPQPSARHQTMPSSLKISRHLLRARS